MKTRRYVRVNAWRSPLRIEARPVDVPAPCTVAQAVQASVPERWRPYAHVAVNGQPVAPDLWSKHTLTEKDVVAVTLVPQGGGFRNILRSVLTLAALSWAGGAGGRFFSRLLGVGFRVGKAFAGALGLLVVNALVPPMRPKLPDLSGSEKSVVYSITGTQNRANYYGAVPVILGRHKVYPPYAARPYTLIQGDDQYLCCLFAVGYGPLTISDLKIGDTALASFSDVEYEIREGTASDSPITIFPNTVTETQLAIDLTNAAGWQTRTTEADTDQAIIDITLPRGLYRMNSDGSLANQSVAVEIAYRETGSAAAWSNPVGYYISGLTLTNKGSGYLPGTYDLVFSGGGGSGAAGRAAVFPGAGRLGARNSVDHVTLTALGNGYTSTPSVTMPASAGGANAVITPSLSSGYQFTAATATPIRRGFVIDFPTRGQYDVRVRRITADTTDTSIADDTQWTAIRSVKLEAPVDTPYNLAMVALKIKATGQLNGVIDTFNCMAQSRCNAWNSTTSTWDADTATQNPADLYRYLLQGPFNDAAVADSRIDLDTLADWAEFCESKGFTFNAVFDSPGTLFDRLRTVAAAGRASLGIKNNKYSVVVDDTQASPVQLFTPRNIKSFRGQRAYVDLPHAFRVRFVNEDNDYLQDERIVYRDGYNADGSGGLTAATKFEALELFGVTDPDAIWKLARYHLAVAEYQQESFTVETDVEHLVCTRGDRVSLVHDVPLVGLASGRVKTVTNDYIVVDELCPVDSLSTTYKVQVRQQNGDVDEWTLTFSSTGEHTTLYRDTGSTSAFNCNVGDLFVFGESGSVVQDCLVKEIEHHEDLSATLTLVPYSDNIYNADSGTIPAYTPTMTVPDDLTQPNPPRNLQAAEYLYRESGDLQQGCTLTWTAPEDTIPDYYEVQVLRPGASSWEQVGTTSEVVWRLENTPAGTYSFRVRTVRGISSSTWETLSDEVLSDATQTVADVTGLRTIYRDNKIMLVWDAVDDVREVEYEVRFGTAWEGGTVLAVQKAMEYAVYVEGTYLVKARVNTTTYSTNAATATIEDMSLPANVIETQDESTAHWPGTFSGCVCPQPPGSAQFKYEPYVGPDFDTWDVEYDGSVEPDAATPAWTLGGTDLASSDGDLLTIGSGGTGTQCYYYRTPSVSLAADEWLTVEARMKIVSGSTEHVLWVHADTAYVKIAFDADTSMTVTAATTTTVNLTATDFNTMRVELGNGYFRLFVNDALEVSGTPATDSTSSDYVLFGKYGTAADTAGTVWDYVNYAVDDQVTGGNEEPNASYWGWTLSGTDLAAITDDYLKITSDGVNNCYYNKALTVAATDFLSLEATVYANGSGRPAKFVLSSSSTFGAGIQVNYTSNGTVMVTDAGSSSANADSYTNTANKAQLLRAVVNADTYWLWLDNDLVLTGDAKAAWGDRILFGTDSSAPAGQYAQIYKVQGGAYDPAGHPLWCCGDLALEGYYTIATGDRVALADLGTVRASAAVEYHGSDKESNLLTMEDLLAEEDLFEGASSKVLAVPQIRYKDDTGAWTTWRTFAAGEYDGSEFDLRLKVTLAEARYQALVPGFSWMIDMEDRIEQDSGVSIDAVGTSITFDREFQKTPSIQVTQTGGASGDTVQVTNMSSTGFTVKILDSGGTGKAGVVDWIAKGY